MIQIESMGWRLGNQLFQLAAAIGLAKKYNDEVAFPVWDYSRYFDYDFSPRTATIESTYHEPHFHYAPIPYKPNMAISGYFQSEKYFEHCKKHIKKAFTLKPIETDLQILPNSCFIHVRRGDYKSLPNHHPLQMWDNYYNRAVQLMDNYFPSRYYIFSDSIDEVRDEFPDNPLFEFVKGNDEITDFDLMTKCKYHIIGNSSYSWWSAYLSKCEDCITIAPSKWFGPAYNLHNTKDLYPNGWLKL